jgi:predicted MFS family arabinose efflux permease
MLLDAPSQTPPPYRRDHRTIAAFGLLAALGSLHTVLGATLPYLRADLGLGYRAASLHLTAFAVGGLVAGLSGATIQDRASRLGLVMLGTLTAVTGVVLVALAGAFAVSLVGAGLIGAGATHAFIGIWSGLSDQHGDRRAVALTEGEVAVSVGNLSLPLAVGVAAAAGLGWRAAVVVVVAAVAAGLLGVRRSGVQEPASAETIAAAAPAREAMRGLAPLLLVVACVVGLEWTLTTWLSSYLDDEVALPRATAVALTSTFFAAVLGGRLLSSRLARRVGARALLAGALALLLAGLPVLLAARGIPVALAGIVPSAPRPVRCSRSRRRSSSPRRTGEHAGERGDDGRRVARGPRRAADDRRARRGAGAADGARRGRGAPARRARGARRAPQAERGGPRRRAR